MKCKKCKQTECEHENLIYCKSCQHIECKDCGKTWGEKETQFVPYYPYQPYEPLYPMWETDTWGTHITTDKIIYTN